MKLLNFLRYGPGEAGKRRKRREKTARRTDRFADASVWQHQDGFAQRTYQSYEAYLEHQRAKLEHHLPQLHDSLDEDLAEFKRRFAGCAELAGARNVLCLGARLGTEVRALKELGFFAVGIDLNPGSGNQHVVSGDFHALGFADGSADAVYCNALDHAFDLDRMGLEIARVLRPGGAFVADILLGFEQGYTPGDYEATIWRDPETLVERLCSAAPLRVAGSRDLGRLRQERWQQIVFRRRADEPISAIRTAPARPARH
ncbi:MAG: class I SAM-dependent methyltransferase [Dongiaceae bacterium]